MTEIYSLESPEFKAIEDNLNAFFSTFYASKKQIPLMACSSINSKIVFLNKFNKDRITNMKRFCHEYDMGFIKWGNKYCITAELTPEIQQYVVYVSKFQCSNGSGLKPAYTIQGKNAEAVVMCTINSFLSYFRINNRIRLNTKSFRYGGDGGYDFYLGKYRFDVKHRDDGPNNGLILRDRYLDTAGDDTILIFATNTTNIKLGTKLYDKIYNDPFDKTLLHLKEQVLPMAITGWMTVGEYKDKKEVYNDEDDKIAWVVDNLNPIDNLFVMIVEDQIESEDWFV